ncbi:DUF2264 domain-containing protein [Nonomuraea endophytica]|uniref:DUF2264 domain-containing protein n=1 Tax=Nonomuraea endophytica TaxID=714136 RepID=A0A7W8A5B9_9ACTN|nr:DUF2264 domain-containing protein [Nonomuraea endophytica]MBB5079815.1 hypothetical protein [Nonomuraea endophytica]
MFPLPPEDRSLSPLTGWTRAHWEAVADGLLGAVEPYRSADGAVITLPGRESSSRCDGLEGYARTFLLASFRVAGGGPVELLEPYGRGLLAGPEVWEPVGERTQPMVEAASIAIGLWLTREQLWDRLPGDVQHRVAGYLAGALRHEPVDNNWWLFPVMVGGFLAAAGFHVEEAEAAVRRGLERIEPWYVGDGWYSDGANRSFDHYNGWAMHLYPVLLALLSQSPVERYGERLREFLTGYALMFDSEGGMLYHGRSLTYRFASTASLFAGALAESTPLTPGQTRGIASATLRRFLEHDALSPEGILTLGWHGPHEPSLQGYSGSASPYWAAKAFLGLLLPADHPVWTATEEPGPQGVRALAGPGLIVQNTGGLARVVNHGSQHHPGDPLYDRYAYSTRTGPTTATDIPDNHAGTGSRGRIVPRGAGSLGDGAWAASFGKGTGVASVSVVRGEVEVRLHYGEVGRETGWALAQAAPDDRVVGTTDESGATAPGGSAIQAVDNTGGCAGRTVGGAVVWGGDGLGSWLIPLAGAVTPSVLEAPEGTAFGRPALVPALTGTGATGWWVSAAVLAHDLPELPSAEVNGPEVTLTWPDGVVHVITPEGPITPEGR